MRRDGLAGADPGAVSVPGEPGPRGAVRLRRGLIPGAGLRRRLRLLLPQQHRQGEREGGGPGSAGVSLTASRGPAKVTSAPRRRAGRSVPSLPVPAGSARRGPFRRAGPGRAVEEPRA